MPVSERGERWHFANKPEDLEAAHRRVVDVLGISIERGQRRHRAHQHAHGVSIVMEAIHELLGVFVNHGVACHLIYKFSQLRLSGQFPVDQQVSRFQEAAVFSQILDGVAAITQNPAFAIEIGD